MEENVRPSDVNLTIIENVGITSENEITMEPSQNGGVDQTGDIENEIPASSEVHNMETKEINDNGTSLLQVRQLSVEEKETAKEQQKRFINNHKQVLVYEKLISERDKEISLQKEKYVKVSRANEIYQKEFTDLKSSMDELKEKVNVLDDELETKTTELDFMHEKYDELTESFNCLKDDLDGKWKEEFRMLELKHQSDMGTMTEEHDAHLKLLQNKMDEAEQQSQHPKIEDAYKLISRKEVEIKEKDKTILNLNEKLKGMQSSEPCIYLQTEIDSKCEVIKSMELSQSKLNDLLQDKSVVIQSQNVIIENLRNSVNSKEESVELTAKKAEVTKLKEQIHQITLEKDNNANLNNKLRDQVTITKKTELTVKTLEEVVNTKIMIIENLQSIIVQLKESPPSCLCTKGTNNLTSNKVLDCIPEEEISEGGTNLSGLNESIGGVTDLPGLNECMMKLKNFALHGVILDGLLLWIDTQRRTVPENVWKMQTLQHFTKEEITNSKNMLWDFNKGNLLGRNISRKGDSKSTSEIDDICNALKTLSAKQVMPTFLGTSTMTMQSPSVETGLSKYQTIDLKLDAIDQFMKNFTKSQTEASKKNHDKIISKADVTHKKVDDLKEKLLHLEASLPKHQDTLHIPNADKHTVNTNNCNDAADFSRTGVNNVQASTPTMFTPHTQENARWNNKVYPDINAYQNDAPWHYIGKGGNTVKELVPPTIFLQENAEKGFGTANVAPTEAVSTVVIKGINNNVTTEQLTSFLVSREVQVINCELLTTYEYANFRTFKVTVKAGDHEKVANASLWPNDVVVQAYKPKIRRKTNGKETPKIFGAHNMGILTPTKREIFNSPNRKLSIRFSNDQAI